MHHVNLLSYTQGKKRFFLMLLQLFCTLEKERWRERVKEKGQKQGGRPGLGPPM